MKETEAYTDRSLWIFTPENPIRMKSKDIVLSSMFNYFIIVCILISGIGLSLERPLHDPDSTLIKVICWIDIITTAVFIIEAILKNFAFGFFFNGPQSYFKSFWNIVDFLIVIFSIVAISPISKHFKMVKMLRVARFLKLVRKNEGMQLAVDALIAATP